MTSMSPSQRHRAERRFDRYRKQGYNVTLEPAYDASGNAMKGEYVARLTENMVTMYLVRFTFNTPNARLKVIGNYKI